ncbi:MAG: alpha/beta hydrolase [Solirubrobacteraceae bacterium]
MRRTGCQMFRAALNQLLYFPERTLLAAPDPMGLRHRELALRTDDGERLHGWWIESRSATIGHLLLCHGNAGNIADRLPHAALLSAAGFDVLLFDYRSYGASTGTPSEPGTYRDARAALRCLLEQPEVDPRRVVYLGESLGGAIGLELALFSPPAGLVLLSTFTSVRALARTTRRRPRRGTRAR